MFGLRKARARKKAGQKAAKIWHDKVSEARNQKILHDEKIRGDAARSPSERSLAQANSAAEKMRNAPAA